MRWVAFVLASGLLSGTAWASEARALIPVTVRVVHPAKVQLSTTASEIAPRAVSGGTELHVGVQASVSGREAKAIQLKVDGCEGAHAEWVSTAQASGERELKLFVPDGASCEPVVVATVQADATR